VSTPRIPVHARQPYALLPGEEDEVILSRNHQKTRNTFHARVGRQLARTGGLVGTERKSAYGDGPVRRGLDSGGRREEEVV
jgi:hypothetical protein